MRNNPVIYRSRGLWCPRLGFRDDAAVALAPGGQILSAGQWNDVRGEVAAAATIDLGDVLLAPGLVNAHSHLEYSFLRGRMPRENGFVAWLKSMVMAKLETPPGEVARAIPAAIEEMAAGGARVVGEICASAAAVKPLASGRCVFGGRLFAEFIAPAARDVESRWRQMNEVVREAASAGGFACGISPHAPYTVAWGAWAQISRFRRRESSGGGIMPQAIHCSETRHEVEMMRRGRGEIFDFLNERELLDADWRAPECSPVEYLSRAGALDEATLLVHCNYIDDGDIEIIKRHGCSVVVCPGTHRWFGHEGHRLRGLLDAEVNVCIGTDSLASNDGLGMLREMRLLREIGPGLDLPLSRLLEMATINGARGLGLAGEWGTLTPGGMGGAIALQPRGAWSSVDDIDLDDVQDDVLPLDQLSLE